MKITGILMLLGFAFAFSGCSSFPTSDGNNLNKIAAELQQIQARTGYDDDGDHVQTDITEVSGYIKSQKLSCGNLNSLLEILESREKDVLDSYWTAVYVQVLADGCKWQPSARWE